MNIQTKRILCYLSGAAKGDAKRGACKKCGEIGHLSFQCFNAIQTKKVVSELYMCMHICPHKDVYF